MVAAAVAPAAAATAAVAAVETATAATAAADTEGGFLSCAPDPPMPARGVADVDPIDGTERHGGADGGDDCGSGDDGSASRRKRSRDDDLCMAISGIEPEELLPSGSRQKVAATAPAAPAGERFV